MFDDRRAKPPLHPLRLGIDEEIETTCPICLKIGLVSMSEEAGVICCHKCERWIVDVLSIVELSNLLL